MKRNLLPDIMTIVGYAAAALFVVFGLYMMFSPQLAGIAKEFRNIFGVVTIGYGLFRAVIIYQKSIQRKENDETDY